MLVWKNDFGDKIFRESSLKNMSEALLFAGNCLSKFRDDGTNEFELENYTPIYMEIVLEALNYCLNRGGFVANFNGQGDNRCFVISRQ
jgi:hypothetical protein